VDPKFRKKKVFSQLYGALDRLALSNKDICGFRLYLDKQNESAKKVYKSMGFKKTSYEVYEMEFLCE
ncbi:MAG: GNAT family N-acetyltransferase, partial [Candidatus Bathyarchaeia archaeon]